MRSAPRSFAALLLALATVFAAPVTASASEGSVPPEVTAYVTGGGLRDRLDAVYGKNAAGDGIDFDDTTTPGPISRVFRWTDARLSGDTEGNATRMANEWAVPVSVGEQPVGVAIVWINLDTELPELAEFDADADAATALAAVPDAARLVRDLGSHAWFALADDTLAPLVAGSSGVTAPVPVADYLPVAPTPAPEPGASDAGFGIAITAAVVLFLVILAALFLLPRVRAWRTPTEATSSPQAADEAAAASEFARPEPDPEV